MEKEELIGKANAGDVDAMLQLIGIYTEEKELSEAIDWADKAAEAGSVNGMYKAVNLHSMRMHGLVAMGMLSGLMPDDAKAVNENAFVLLRAHREGLIDLNDRIYSNLLSALRDGIYFEALSCYFTEPSDYNQIEHLLKDADTAREQFLCGCAYCGLKRYDDASRKFSTACTDREYLNAEKETGENSIFAIAMYAYSEIERVNGKLDRAVMILNQAIEAITDEEVKAPLQKELGRYQKKMFGGWKYI